METPRAFLLRKHDEVLLASTEAQEGEGEPWRTRLALLRHLAAWEWAESAFLLALGEISARTVHPAEPLDPQVAAAFAGELLREWEAWG